MQHSLAQLEAELMPYAGENDEGVGSGQADYP